MPSKWAPKYLTVEMNFAGAEMYQSALTFNFLHT